MCNCTTRTQCKSSIVLVERLLLLFHFAIILVLILCLIVCWLVLYMLARLQRQLQLRELNNKRSRCGSPESAAMNQMERIDDEIERWKADIKEHHNARERGLAVVSLKEIHAAENTLDSLVKSLQSK